MIRKSYKRSGLASILSIMLLILIICGCVENKQVVENQKETEFLQYIDHEWGISFKYPEGWIKSGMVDPGKKESVSFTAEDMATIFAGVEILEEPTSLGEFTDSYLGQAQTDGIGEIIKRDVTLGGKKAVEFRYENSLAQRAISVICIEGNRIYSISGQADFYNFDKHLPLFEEAINSFEFIDNK
jgi:predicted Zn-dependent protease